MKISLIVVLIIVLAVIIFIFSNREESVTPGTGETGSPQSAAEKSPSLATIRKQGELKDVTGGSSSGMAQTLFEKGRFTHSVIALMPDSPVGKFYEGWLVKKEGGKVVNFFSTGKMIKEGGAYILNFEDNKDYPEHNDVVITLEVKDDKQPEIHILEGTLSVVNQ